MGIATLDTLARNELASDMVSVESTDGSNPGRVVSSRSSCSPVRRPTS